MRHKSFAEACREEHACRLFVQLQHNSAYISVITIKRAWEELERSGLITTNVGRGCFVAQLTEQKRNEMRMEIAQAEVKKLMPLFRLLGLTAEDAVFIIKKEYS